MTARNVTPPAPLAPLPTLKELRAAQLCLPDMDDAQIAQYVETQFRMFANDYVQKNADVSDYWHMRDGTYFEQEYWYGPQHVLRVLRAPSRDVQAQLVAHFRASKWLLDMLIEEAEGGHSVHVAWRAMTAGDE